MRETLVQLVSTLSFLVGLLLLMCLLIMVFQLIFNAESRYELRCVMKYIAQYFKKIKRNILLAMLNLIEKALCKTERGNKHENPA